MKKGLILIFALPLLCSCSGSTISSEETLRMLSNFETKLDQTTTFAYFERNSVEQNETRKSIRFYQVFFDKNFIHSYTIKEDDEVADRNTAVEEWSFIQDGYIYEVTTEGAEESAKGKIYNAYTYDKDMWEKIMKKAFDETKLTNVMYYSRLKSELRNSGDDVKITTKSKNDSSLTGKLETYNSSGKVTVTKNYIFEECLITEFKEKNEYSTKEITFKYHVTTQEVNYPDI